jgi:ABC-type transporter Mla subunit MlaD
MFVMMDPLPQTPCSSGSTTRIKGIGTVCVSLLSDMILWAVLGAVLLGGILAMDWNALPFIPHRKAQVSLHVSDAYSLTKGSPVNFMGVRVGSVEKVYVSANKDEVHVDLALNQWLEKIPPNAEANIVAAGLGGAKRLEFTMPNTTAQMKVSQPTLSQKEGAIRVLEPFRQKTLWGHQIKAANALRHGANALGQALDGVTAGSQYTELNAILTRLDETNAQIAQYQNDLPRLGNRFHSFASNLENSFQALDAKLQTLNGYAVAWNSGQRDAFQKNVQQSRVLLKQQRQLLQELNQRMQVTSQTPPSLEDDANQGLIETEVLREEGSLPE